MREHLDPTAETVKVMSALGGRKTCSCTISWRPDTPSARGDPSKRLKAAPLPEGRDESDVFTLFCFFLQRNPFHADAFWEEYQIDLKAVCSICRMINHSREGTERSLGHFP